MDNCFFCPSLCFLQNRSMNFLAAQLSSPSCIREMAPLFPTATPNKIQWPLLYLKISIIILIAYKDLIVLVFYQKRSTEKGEYFWKSLSDLAICCRYHNISKILPLNFQHLMFQPRNFPMTYQPNLSACVWLVSEMRKIIKSSSFNERI